MRRLITALAMGLMLALAGCSPTGEMAKNLTLAAQLTAGIQRDAEQAEAAVEEGRDAVPFCRAARAKAGKLAKIIPAVQRLLPQVQDRPDPLSQVVTLARWAAVILCGLLALYLGLGKVIRPVLNRCGLWLDRSLVTSAEMDVKLLNREVTAQEMVAAKRGTPTYNQAYRKAKKKAQGDTS